MVAKENGNGEGQVWDFMIVGLGVAGCVLADTLRGMGQKTLVYDRDKPDTSSKVAAGLFNPITGQNYVKTWEADDIFPCLNRYYKGFEQRLGVSFYHPKNIYRPYDSVERQNFWLAKSSDTAFSEYIKDNADDGLYSDSIQAPHGGVEILQGGFVDLKPMLFAFRERLKSEGALREGFFDETLLSFSENGVEYMGESAKKIIFCIGSASSEAALFKGLPFRRTKGEILEIKMPGANLKNIANKGCWLIPAGNDTYKAGSTYEWQDLTSEPTDKAKNHIVAHIDKLVKLPYTVQSHYAGVRPTTRDRHPFVGLHPKNKLLGIFNGLGTKGVSQAPYLAARFAGYLLGQDRIPEEADIARYAHLL